MHNQIDLKRANVLSPPSRSSPVTFPNSSYPRAFSRCVDRSQKVRSDWS
jgi:hypothetical protein